MMLFQQNEGEREQNEMKKRDFLSQVTLNLRGVVCFKIFFKNIKLQNDR